MKPSRQLPQFITGTVAQWLEGHQERVYAVTGNFTFSLMLEGSSVVRFERYSDPAKVPDYRFPLKLSPHTTMRELLTRWQEVFPAKVVIQWDASVIS